MKMFTVLYAGRPGGDNGSTNKLNSVYLHIIYKQWQGTDNILPPTKAYVKAHPRTTFQAIKKGKKRQKGLPVLRRKRKRRQG